MLAAGFAARAGARVLLLEKMKTSGRKLAITGKGRCNLTNTAGIEDFLARFGRNGRFLRQALQDFGPEALRDFFTGLGLETVVERGGRVFPAGGRAPDVVKILRSWLRREKVEVRLANRVHGFEIRNSRIAGVETGNGTLPAGAVILACGGASYPATGSDGDGFRLAADLGHRIIPPRPALVPLIVKNPLSPNPAGLNLRNVGIELLVNRKKVRRLLGELTFNEDGLGGPTILTLSGRAVDALEQHDEVAIRIDLKPALDEQELDRRLQKDLRQRGREEIASILRGLLPRELVPCALIACRIDRRQPGCEITAAERRRLRHWLKNLTFEITASRPLAEAIITAGGVSLKEVNPRTMASRLVDNLFFAGEILDLQADTGGYNLQAAFATGKLAGQSAATFIKS
ncbi:MAG: NAD(P)/FAD-dependent oxidoreductase [Deltaproteobacteria bacterium]|nr:NAD(P)/FAD-dependent oxidoreductase [Deltaproteobacteria bacterium]